MQTMRVHSESNSSPVPLKEDYLPFLDGLRGLAAVWVMASHSIYLAQAGNIPLLKRGDVAVDLFMIMSGFLMAYHYYVRQTQEPWEEPRTWWKFYVRRFFRIAPLYYLLFALNLLIGPAILNWRESIAQVFPTTIPDAERFVDRSWMNILMHISFLFGLSPHYSVNTPMPDWSIGLEMQFYLAFPFLMLLLRKNFILGSALLYMICRAINNHFVHQAFYKPSFLTISLSFFLIGILLATYNRYKQEPFKAMTAVAAALVLAWLTYENLTVVIVVLVLLLLNRDALGKPVKWIYNALSSRLARWLADMSYCAYLLHLALMTPMAYLCSRKDVYMHQPGPVRALVLFLLTAATTYPVSMALFHGIEKQGILWGKKLVKRL